MKTNNKARRLLAVLFAAMMVLVLIPATTAFAAEDVAINETNFPDAIFRQYVADNFDTDDNGVLSSSEAVSKDNIDIDNRGISSLKGIEYFTALKYLYCSQNQLTSLDLSKNTALTNVGCWGNALTSLDVSKCIDLKNLYCNRNKLTSLDVSNNTKLELLWCQNNQLTSLDLSKNAALVNLYCGTNKLASLDVSNNIAAKRIDCSENQIAALDVSKNINLESFLCDDNQLTSIDVSNNLKLYFFSCQWNQLTNLDLSKNTALTDLYCGSNPITVLDISNNTALEELWCWECQVTSLDISKHPNLKDMYTVNNSYKIELNEDNTFDLSTLPGDFDVTKVSYWIGGKVDGNILTVNANRTGVVYNYDIGNGKTEDFRLTFDPHTHNYGEKWKTDADKHWKECACGDKSEEAVHEFEIVNAKEATTTETGYTGDKVCKVCKYEAEKGTEIPVHVHSNKDGEWKTDADKHWKECECGDKIEEAAHELEVVNAKEATATEAGYTGDKVCKVCGYVAEKGKEIPATGDDNSVTLGEIADLFEQIFSNIDPETIKGVYEQTKDTIGNIIDVIKPLFDSKGEQPTNPPVDSTDPDADGNTGSTGDATTPDGDASTGGSDAGVPDTGATASIAAIATLSVAAAAAFVSKKKKD